MLGARACPWGVLPWQKGHQTWTKHTHGAVSGAYSGAWSGWGGPGKLPRGDDLRAEASWDTWSRPGEQHEGRAEVDPLLLKAETEAGHQATGLGGG